MTVHVFQQQARTHRDNGIPSRQSHLGWLRRNLLRRARLRQQQQQPTAAHTPTMQALYALALAVVDEQGLD